MLVKEFLSLLSKVDPEAEVNFEVGNNHTYRVACAQLVLEDDGSMENDGDACLAYMDVSRIDQHLYGNSSEVCIHLVQSYYKDEYFEERLKKAHKV